MIWVDMADNIREGVPSLAFAVSGFQDPQVIRWIGIGIVVFGLAVIVLRKWRDR